MKVHETKRMDDDRETERKGMDHDRKTEEVSPVSLQSSFSFIEKDRLSQFQSERQSQHVSQGERQNVAEDHRQTERHGHSHEFLQKEAHRQQRIFNGSYDDNNGNSVDGWNKSAGKGKGKNKRGKGKGKGGGKGRKGKKGKGRPVDEDSDSVGDTGIKPERTNAPQLAPPVPDPALAVPGQVPNTITPVSQDANGNPAPPVPVPPLTAPDGGGLTVGSTPDPAGATGLGAVAGSAPTTVLHANAMHYDPDGTPHAKPVAPSLDRNGHLVDDVTAPVQPDFTHLNMVEALSIMILCVIVLAGAGAAALFVKQKNDKEFAEIKQKLLKKQAARKRKRKELEKKRLQQEGAKEEDDDGEESGSDDGDEHSSEASNSGSDMPLPSPDRNGPEKSREDTMSIPHPDRHNGKSGSGSDTSEEESSSSDKSEGMAASRSEGPKSGAHSKSHRSSDGGSGSSSEEESEEDTDIENDNLNIIGATSLPDSPALGPKADPSAGEDQEPPTADAGIPLSTVAEEDEPTLVSEIQRVKGTIHVAPESGFQDRDGVASDEEEGNQNLPKYDLGDMFGGDDFLKKLKGEKDGPKSAEDADPQSGYPPSVNSTLSRGVTDALSELKQVLPSEKISDKLESEQGLPTEHGMPSEHPLSEKLASDKLESEKFVSEVPPESMAAGSVLRSVPPEEESLLIQPSAAEEFPHRVNESELRLSDMGFLGIGTSQTLEADEAFQRDRDVETEAVNLMLKKQRKKDRHRAQKQQAEAEDAGNKKSGDNSKKKKKKHKKEDGGAKQDENEGDGKYRETRVRDARKTDFGRKSSADSISKADNQAEDLPIDAALEEIDGLLAKISTDGPALGMMEGSTLENMEGSALGGIGENRNSSLGNLTGRNSGVDNLRLDNVAGNVVLDHSGVMDFVDAEQPGIDGLLESILEAEETHNRKKDMRKTGAIKEDEVDAPLGDAVSVAVDSDLAGPVVVIDIPESKEAFPGGSPAATKPTISAPGLGIDSSIDYLGSSRDENGNENVVLGSPKPRGTKLTRGPEPTGVDPKSGGSNFGSKKPHAAHSSFNAKKRVGGASGNEPVSSEKPEKHHSAFGKKKNPHQSGSAFGKKTASGSGGPGSAASQIPAVAAPQVSFTAQIPALTDSHGALVFDLNSLAHHGTSAEYPEAVAESGNEGRDTLGRMSEGFPREHPGFGTTYDDLDKWRPYDRDPSRVSFELGVDLQAVQDDDDNGVMSFDFGDPKSRKSLPSSKNDHHEYVHEE